MYAIRSYYGAHNSAFTVELAKAADSRPTEFTETLRIAQAQRMKEDPLLFTLQRYNALNTHRASDSSNIIMPTRIGNTVITDVLMDTGRNNFV